MLYFFPPNALEKVEETLKTSFSYFRQKLPTRPWRKVYGEDRSLKMGSVLPRRWTINRLQQQGEQEESHSKLHFFWTQQAKQRGSQRQEDWSFVPDLSNSQLPSSWGREIPSPRIIRKKAIYTFERETIATHVKRADFGWRVASSEINSALKSSTGQQVAPKIRLREEDLKGARCDREGHRAAAPQRSSWQGSGTVRPNPASGREASRGSGKAASPLWGEGGGSPSEPGEPGRAAALRSGGRAAAAFARLRGGREAAPEGRLRWRAGHTPLLLLSPVPRHSPPRWEMCRQRKRCRLGRWRSPGHLRRRAEVRTYPPSVESRYSVADILRLSPA